MHSRETTGSHEPMKSPGIGHLQTISCAMNGDQLAARFGDANAAEPPTPEQSPTSAISPSAVFARPETGWTPACTDGYPIQGPFGHFGDLGELGELGDLGSTTSHLPSSALGPKRPLPFEGLAAETASKKARPGTSARESAVQQATTPPPSARKADHELASQPRTNAMQHGQGFDQPYFFMTAPTDVFGYPLAAPAAGPAFTDQRYVWDADSAMAGIDMDFATAGHAIFQSPAIGHRPMDSLDWAKIANLIFQESPAKREGETASADQGVFADAFSPPMPNIFGPVDWPLDKPHGDVFMVQCDTCEMLLHSHCINMTRRTLTSIYICAFCAHTKVRDGGVRNSGRASAGATAPTSPLAHKSVKNFR
ncbi:hypothetical protein P8C59_004681 [Phyllachora maydis]|uniref:Zinc finger PHD-type domain-containing protein n=1 Tax=Phyllachora maydis TaxID=1825666 RepID=A0AAD9I2W9_9PEZI|nr:hypothetical protein P8C59_004681 [Phyllachora maydis]